MNDAQKFLLDKNLGDLVLSQDGGKYVYASDAMICFIKNNLKANSGMIEILTAFVELEDSGLSEPSRIRYQTQRARDLLKLY